MDRSLTLTWEVVRPSYREEEVHSRHDERRGGNWTVGMPVRDSGVLVRDDGATFRLDIKRLY